MDNALILNVLKKYIHSEESTVRIDSVDLIEMARQKIVPSQSNALEREMQILEDFIHDLDVAIGQ